MALILEKTIKGFTSNYWIITKRQDNKFDQIEGSEVIGTTFVELSLFKDSETRYSDGLENRITFTTFLFEGINYSFAELYTKIKTTEIFVNAEDC